MKFKLMALLIILYLLLAGCAPSGCGDGVCSDMELKDGKCTADCKPEEKKDVSVIKEEEPERINIIEKPMQGKFELGIEYGPLGLAEVYSETGAHAVKPYPELIMWKNIQSSASSGYNWGNVDAIVKEYQDAGFDKMQMLITAESPWASRDASGLKPRDTRPKEQYEDAYARFVGAAVERYDKDGVDDMPGLKHAINEWGVEREFSGFWPGSGAEYVELLKLAYPAIKKANPNAKVMTAALLMVNTFAGNPEDNEFAARLQKPLIGAKSLSEVYVMLDSSKYYDVVDVHLLGDYSEIPATVRWLNKELERRGAKKEIYGGDAFPMSPLLAYGLETCNAGLFAAKEIYPVTPETRCEASKIISAMRGKNDPDHKKAHEWLEKNIALNIPRKYVVAANEGIAGMNIGNMEDWFLPIGAGTASDMGLIDTASMSDIVRKPKDKRPGFYSLEMTIRHLGGFESVRKMELGKNIYAYEFINNGKRIVVAWYDDGKFYGMDSNTPIVNVEIQWPKNSAKVTEVPTKRGDQEGKTQFLGAANGSLKLSLGYVPIFIV